MINDVIESGYVGKYINTGTSRTGAKWVSFQLYQKTGKETNQYLPCVVWDNERNKLASSFEERVKTGNYLLIKGHLTVHKTEDRKTEIQLVVDSIKDNVEPAPRASSGSAQPKPTNPFTMPEIESKGIEITSDDLPF